MKIKVVKFTRLFQVESVTERNVPNNQNIMINVPMFGWYRGGTDKNGFQFCDHASGAKIFKALSSAKNSDVYKRFKDCKLFSPEISWSKEIEE